MCLGAPGGERACTCAMYTSQDLEGGNSGNSLSIVEYSIHGTPMSLEASREISHENFIVTVVAWLRRGGAMPYRRA